MHTYSGPSCVLIHRFCQLPWGKGLLWGLCSFGESLYRMLPEARLHWLLDARAKCSSERIEPRKISTLFWFKWTERLSFMCILYRAVWLLFQLTVLYQLQQEWRRKRNVCLRATVRVADLCLGYSPLYWHTVKTPSFSIQKGRKRENIDFRFIL